MKNIFVNGCFDIIHRGHIELFKYAKSLGGLLHVAIDSDERVKQKKGNSRPVNTQQDRLFILQSLKYIDLVYIFDSDNELVSLIKDIKPDIMIVGSDWKNDKIIGSEYARELRFFERIERYSTTKLIQSIAYR